MNILDALEFFRIHFAARPLLLLAGLLLVALLVRRTRLWTSCPADRCGAFAARLLACASLAGGFAYAAIAIAYATSSHYFDNAEPTMTAVGWLLHVGKPVYHAIDSPERYAHIYGPFAFIAHGWALALFGPGIAASKWLGTIAALVALASLFAALRTEAPVVRAAVLTSACALMLLLFRNYSFWTRPEPLQLLCVSAALAFTVRGQGVPSAILTGVSVGVLCNLKLTGALYTLPIFALLVTRRSWRAAALAIAVTAAVAIAPFVFFPNVSWDGYMLWVRLSGATGLLLATLRQNIEWAIYLAMPVFIAWFAAGPGRRRSGLECRWFSIALCAGTCGVLVAAAKPGAGPYHLIPMLPLVMYASAYQLRHVPDPLVSRRAAAVSSVAFVVVAVSIAIAQQAQFLTTMRERASRDEAVDVERFADAHPGVVEMGYGGTEALSHVRPVLVFRNNAYLLDQPAVREHQLAGIPIPPATIDALRRCRVDYWLIPKGEEPFSGRNAYDAVLLMPLYSDDFRRAFRETHTLADTTAYYDAWKCERGRSR